MITAMPGRSLEDVVAGGSVVAADGMVNGDAWCISRVDGQDLTQSTAQASQQYTPRRECNIYITLTRTCCAMRV